MAMVGIAIIAIDIMELVIVNLVMKQAVQFKDNVKHVMVKDILKMIHCITEINMQSISELYQEQCDKVYKLIEKDNKKFNLIIKYGHRSWKERLFSYPWKPWQDYVSKEKYYDVKLIGYDDLKEGKTYLNNDGSVTISFIYDQRED
jgi:hypothetical protein